nr:4'-phosphopantetheinyl transferase [uncultured bacterium]
MIERLLPAAMAWSESFGDEDCTLFPEEEAVITRAVAKRRREFTTARWCARQALSALGVPAVPIVPGGRGAPRWPPDLVGSITHCAGYRAAVAARASAITTVGIDAEPHAPVPPGVYDSVSRPEERELLSERARTVPEICWDRLLFSAKESVYKAWYPLAQRWLDFDEARISFALTGEGCGTFHAELLVPGPAVPGHGVLSAFTGRWQVDRGLVVTAVALEASGGPA